MSMLIVVTWSRVGGPHSSTRVYTRAFMRGESIDRRFSYTIICREVYGPAADSRSPPSPDRCMGGDPASTRSRSAIGCIGSRARSVHAGRLLSESAGCLDRFTHSPIVVSRLPRPIHTLTSRNSVYRGGLQFDSLERPFWSPRDCVGEVRYRAHLKRAICATRFGCVCARTRLLVVGRCCWRKHGRDQISLGLVEAIVVSSARRG
jgi:hypothetical protein